MRNTVIHGDCLEEMRAIPDKSIDMILADLPYGTTACKWDTIIPFEPLWKQYERIIKDNGAIVLTASQPFTSALVMSNPKLYKTSYVWDKKQSVNFTQAKRHPLKRTEDILVFGKKTVKYNPRMVERTKEELEKHLKKKTKKNGGKTPKKDGSFINISGGNWESKTNFKYKYPTNILEFSSVANECNSKHKIHPTQKPVALFEYLIKTYTNPGDLVLDNAAGSGTTAIAAMNTGRDYILIEKEQEYIDIINKRIENHKQGAK